MRIILYTFILLMPLISKGQELFPHNEPASNAPKGVFGVKVFGESFRELVTQRNMFAIRFIYGLTPKLTIHLTASGSNHHGKNLPNDFVAHTQIGNQTFYYTQKIKKGIQYSYRYNGLNFYMKYRFFTHDGQKKHLRMAFYGDCSNVKTAHDEAEPNLLDDTRGYGFGIITTYLKNKFAASLTTGIIIPNRYKEKKSLNGISLLTQMEVQYGKAILYNLSFGYLLYPNNYKDYSQSNWNIYLEFIGKSYQRAKVFRDGFELETKSNLLTAGHYVEIHPGIQKIVNSNLRIDLSCGFNFLKNSYVRFYPVWMLGIQKYFYTNRK